MRYNDVKQCFEGCDGTDWACLVKSVCDNTPAFFPFTEQTGLATSSLTLSNIALVTGMDAACDVDVSVSGADGNPEYRVCDAADCSSVVQDWTAANSTLAMEGLYMQLRATTDAAAGISFTITGNIGSASSNWTITTLPADCSLSPIGTVCADGSVYAGTSPASGTPMYATRCDAGMSWDGSNCVNARSAMPWNNGNGGNYVDTPVSNCTAPCVGDDGQANTPVIVATDADSGAAGFQPHQAASYCDTLNLHGQTDWYLPALPEVNEMFGSRVAIGNFDTSGTYYWSSSENYVHYAWRQRFSDGYQNTHYKNHANAVRCVRR